MTGQRSRPVRRGGVGVLGQPRPGLLPDVVGVTPHQGAAESAAQGEGAQVSAADGQTGVREAHKPMLPGGQPLGRWSGTGKRCTGKPVRTVWGGADAKGLVTVPRRPPTLLVHISAGSDR